jgi:hypothetical protein
MNEFQKFSVGEQLRASRLNEMVDYSRAPYAAVPSYGGHIFGSQHANGSSNNRLEPVILVYATEDFSIQVSDAGTVDDVASGLCDFVRLSRPLNVYENVTGRAFQVHDVLASLSNSASKSAGDIFYAVWNHDSKRWEALSASGIRLQAAHVVRCLGKGWHEIELCEWDGRPDQAAIDSASDSESCDGDLEAQAFSHCDMQCDSEPCDNIEDGAVPMDRCLQIGEQIHYPIYAHTCRQLPMRVGGMCKVIRRFGDPEGTISLSDSISGSESADDPWYYDVVDGEWPLQTLQRETWVNCVDELTGECTAIMTQSQRVLFEGYACDPVDGEDCHGIESGSESAS